MDCSEAKQQLPALASGRLASEDEAEVRAHLESCEECRLELELLVGPPAPAPPLAEAPPEPVLEVAPLAPPTSDWTVEKIFGNDQGGTAAPSGGTETAASAPESEAAPLFALETTAETAASPAVETAPIPEPEPMPAPAAAPVGVAPGKSKSTSPRESWDFEPADAARDVTPPEESLVFAEQALNRRLDDPNKKNAALRSMLWGGGALVGVGLLGVAVWMVLAQHAAPPREISTRVQPSERVPVAITHSAPGAAETGVSGDGRSAAASPGMPSGTAPTNSERSSVASSSATPPATTPTPAATPIKSGLASTSTATSVPAPGKPAKPSLAKPTTAPAPPAAAATTAAKSGGKANDVPDTKPVAGGSTAKDPFVAEKPTASAAGTPAPRVKRDDDDMWPTDDPIRVTPVAPKAVVPAKASPGTSTPATDDRAPSAAKPAPGASTPPAVAAPEQTKPPAPDAPPKELRPIDRIHAATEQAAKDHDLITLRQLKLTWRNLVRTVVGPDRSRAKREFADCLWEIQTLSGRDADQREALAAYRDFLLSAPAGGADARSAARLRELEDALAERR